MGIILISTKLISMAESAPSTIIPAAGEEFWGIDGSIVMYGLIADILCVVPLVVYLTVVDQNGWAAYHQTYINMLWSSYAPIAISWWIVLADDSKFAREILTGAIEVAGVGPFAVLWVGMATYLMQSKDAGQLVSGNSLLWMWGPLYFAINMLLIVLHYHVSPVMYAWLALAPQRVAGVDGYNAWAQPKDWGVVAAEVDAVPEEDEPMAFADGLPNTDVSVDVEAEIDDVSDA